MEENEALTNLTNRLKYQGGIAQEGRMQKAKLETLRKALLYSYQAATAILADGREFRCLINPDRLKVSAEEKIISIPFEDICLNKPRVGKITEGLEEIGMKTGDVFEWKETETYWLVYLRRIEEDAYFRAEIRKCNTNILIGEKEYKAHIYGPAVKTISWETKHQSLSWNNLNYDLQLYITKDENTLEFFHRFTKVMIENRPWEVQTVDSLSTEGIMIVSLKETNNNEFNPIENKIKTKEEDAETADENIEIIGETAVYPFDRKEYSIREDLYSQTGKWIISNNKAKIINSQDNKILIEVVTGKSGKFELVYQDGLIEYILPIDILPL